MHHRLLYSSNNCSAPGAAVPYILLFLKLFFFFPLLPRKILALKCDLRAHVP